MSGVDLIPVTVPINDPVQVRIDPDLARQVGFHARACAMPTDEVISRILRAHFSALEAEKPSGVTAPPIPLEIFKEASGGVGRYSALGGKLFDTFLMERLKGATEMVRISGYFRSTLLHEIRKRIDPMIPVRILCNAELDPRDILTARIVNGSNEKLPEGERFRTLHDLLKSGVADIRVMKEDKPFLLHGKAGLIRYQDGKTCTFSGSANDTVAAWSRNYEIVWDDPSEGAADWFMNEFATLWAGSIPLHEATSTLVQLPDGSMYPSPFDGDTKQVVVIDPPPPSPLSTRKLPDLPDMRNVRVESFQIGAVKLSRPNARALLSEALYQLCWKLSEDQVRDVELIRLHVGIPADRHRTMLLHYDDRIRLSYQEQDLQGAILCAWKAARAIGERLQVDLIDGFGAPVQLLFDPNEVSRFDRDEQVRNPLHERPLVGPGMSFRVLYEDERRVESFYILRNTQDPFIGRDVKRLPNGSPLARELMDRMAGETATLNVDNRTRRVRILDVWRPDLSGDQA
jgi:hypothetical protein